MKLLSLLLTLFISPMLLAPSENRLPVYVPEPVNPYEVIFEAVCLVESSGNPFAIGDKHLSEYSYGIVQIRKERIDDYAKKTGIFYTCQDMFDKEKSKTVFMFYASQLEPWNIEAISRSWNAGPNWRNVKMSEEYYKKVYEQIKSKNVHKIKQGT